MKKINLNDGTEIYCLKETEAIVLDDHIAGYMEFDVNIKTGSTVIDVGANIGVFGVRLLQKNPNIHIHCFEPIPDIYKVLKKNSELHSNKYFQTYMMGLSHKNTELNFTYYPNSPALSTAKPEIWDLNKSNFTAAVKGNIVAMQSQFWWAKIIPNFLIPIIIKYLKSNKKEIKSQVITLSHFIEEKKISIIDLLKIDCEGEEINVLHGIKEKHWKLINTIIMEVNDIKNNLNTAKNILTKNGFNNIKMEKEKGFENTQLINIYASK